MSYSRMNIREMDWVDGCIAWVEVCYSNAVHELSMVAVTVTAA